MSEKLPVHGPVDKLKVWRDLAPPALWITKEAHGFLREKGIPATPEIQFELQRIADEEKTRRPLTQEQVEKYLSRLKEVFTNGEVQQRLIEEALPELSSEKKSFEDEVAEIEVFHLSGTPAKLRVRATTKRGFKVFVANIPSPSTVRIEKKIAETKRKWDALIGTSISFAPKKSSNNRNFLTITASSLPEDLRKK